MRDLPHGVLDPADLVGASFLFQLERFGPFGSADFLDFSAFNQAYWFPRLHNVNTLTFAQFFYAFVPTF